MIDKKKSVGIVLVTAVIMSVIRLFLIINNMEKSIYETDTYYLAQGPSVVAFTVASVLLVLVFALFAYMLGKGRVFRVEAKGNCIVVVSCVLAVLLVGAAVMYMLSFDEDTVPKALDVIVAALSILSAAVFISTCIYSNCSKSVYMLLGLLPILLSIFRLLSDFVSSNAAPLASSGGFHIVGLVAMMLYFLCENKSYHNQGSAALYLLFGYVAVFFLFVYAFPNLFMHCFGFFSFDNDACYSAVDLAVAVYIATRISNIKLETQKKIQ